MQLTLLNNYTFEVASLTEVISLERKEDTMCPTMFLIMKLVYNDSLVSLFPAIEELDFTVFSIGDREYKNFSFERLEQVAEEDFSNISTLLHLKSS